MKRIIDFLEYENDKIREVSNQLIRIVRRYDLEIHETFNGVQVLNLTRLLEIGIISEDVYNNYWKEMSGIRYEPNTTNAYVSLKSALFLIYLSAVTTSKTVKRYTLLKKIKTATSFADLPVDYCERIDEQLSKFLSSEDYDNNTEGLDRRYLDYNSPLQNPPIGEHFLEN